MLTADQYLEVVVAGIQRAANGKALVSWNEEIEGRQFDVVVRFTLGLVRYLVIVEVKNKSRAASANDVESFITKSDDKLANKAIFVSASGFQSGAKEVALRHGIDLFQVSFVADELQVSPNLTWIHIGPNGTEQKGEPNYTVGQPHPVIYVEGIRLNYSNGNSFDLPGEQSQMTYYARKSVFSDGRSLAKLVSSQPVGDIGEGETRKSTIELDYPVRLHAPDNFYFPDGEVVSIQVEITRGLGRLVSGDSSFEPSVFSVPVDYTNVITGETTRFSIFQLPLGVNKLQVGKFYFTVHPLAYFYCNSIKNGQAHWYLIESFQNGNLLTAETYQPAKFSSLYLQVMDSKIVSRLERRLVEFKVSRSLQID